MKESKTCIEKKILLSGAVQAYSCELLHYESNLGILRYVIDREYDVHGVKLSPGDETIALYWKDRPYTLYVWRRQMDQDTAYYFNIADRISLTPQEFIWRDLAVDILIDHAGAHVLDEHELPADLDTDLDRYINEAKAHILIHYEDIIQEICMLRLL